MDKINNHFEICKMLNALYAKKNADYGDSFSKSFVKYGWVMPCIRLEDKLNRFTKLALSGEQKVDDESIEDTLLDLANYAIMTVLEMEMIKNA